MRNKAVLYLFSLICLLFVPLSLWAQSSSEPYSAVYPLTLKEGMDIAKEAFQKAQFFNILEFNEDGKSWVEGQYAKMEMKDPTRYLGYQDQSRLYQLSVTFIPVKDKPRGVSYNIQTVNEGVFGRNYNQVVKSRFEQEFNKRLEGFKKFREQPPAEMAKKYLNGEDLAAQYGYTTIKLLNLVYTEPKTWANYLTALRFIQKECLTDGACQETQKALLAQEDFWPLLEGEVQKNPKLLHEVGQWVGETDTSYPKYLALLNKSAENPLTALDEEAANIYENDSIPAEWRNKGVGTEKARGVERKFAFKSYDYLKRGCSFDVDTEEVLMMRRIASKLIPYALRKGLDYQVHIYDDSKPGKCKPNKNNAFTSGGGILYISRSLIQKLDPKDEAAIAAVVAHELGHNEAYHIQRQVMRMETINAVVQLSSIGDVFVPGVSTLTSQVGTLAFYKMSRNDEYEADRLGLYLLYKAGYDPKGMERIFEAFNILSKRKWTSPYDTHPSSPARKKRIQYLAEHREVLDKTNLDNAAEDLLGEK